MSVNASEQTVLLTAGEVRVAMTRNGGNMADPGSVSYLFSRKGIITLEKNGLSEDDVLAAVLEAGAEEINDLGESFEIISEPTDLVAVRTALQEAGIDYESADASFQPSVTVPVDIDAARKVLKLVDALEDSDDVQDVYTKEEFFVHISELKLFFPRRCKKAIYTGEYVTFTPASPVKVGEKRRAVDVRGVANGPLFCEHGLFTYKNYYKLL